MAQIRPETEDDRTQQALATDGLTLPLAHGTVEIVVSPGIEKTSGGQRLIVLLINELARMKGVVGDIHLVTDADPEVLRATPLSGASFVESAIALVESLNAAGSQFRASLRVGTAHSPDVRVQVGRMAGEAEIVVASDGWRALLGHFAEQADWSAANPIGPAIAAAIAAAEVFKWLVYANAGEGSNRFAPADFAYSAFNYGVDADAAVGPDVGSLQLADLAIVGCGAGGSGVAYILAMHPRLSGVVALIEPDKHKLSNLNRYLASTAEDVHSARHKLSSLTHHLACFAPGLALELHAQPWEQLDRYPWDTLVSAVDTVEARWSIQRRADGATIIDLAVHDLLYSVLRVVPGGRCLLCKHPYDPELATTQRAARWGVPLETVREWTVAGRMVDAEMIDLLARTQGKSASAFGDLLGVPFTETPRLLECGSTSMRADVPSQAPVLPLATTAVAAIGAAEVIKHFSGLAPLDNWLAHDLRRNPSGPWSKSRRPVEECDHGVP